VCFQAWGRPAQFLKRVFYPTPLSKTSFAVSSFQRCVNATKTFSFGRLAPFHGTLAPKEIFMESIENFPLPVLATDPSAGRIMLDLLASIVQYADQSYNTFLVLDPDSRVNHWVNSLTW
jgi:hypothetical protein